MSSSKSFIVLLNCFYSTTLSLAPFYANSICNGQPMRPAGSQPAGPLTQAQATGRLARARRRLRPQPSGSWPWSDRTGGALLLADRDSDSGSESG